MECVLHIAGQWRDCPLEELPSCLQDETAFAWIELRNGETGPLQRLEKILGLHELAVEDALSARQRPKLEEYQDTLFLVMRTAREWNGGVEFGETHVFLGRRFLLTVRHGTDPGYARALERLRKGRFGVNAGAALYVLLDWVVDAYRPLVEHLEERYASYESILLDSDQAVENLPRIYALKRETLALQQAIEPMMETVQQLVRLHPEIAEKGLKAYYRDVQDHLVRQFRSLDLLREMLTDAMQLSLASLSLRQNESVQKLAGWGAILAIPTLVFSLYGMNFKFMPELEWRLGYPLVLMATAAGCFALYRRLKRRGWI